MPEPTQQPERKDDAGYFHSDCNYREIREEDTQPGKMSDQYRKMLEEKYGNKKPPQGGPEKNP